MAPKCRSSKAAANANGWRGYGKSGQGPKCKRAQVCAAVASFRFCRTRRQSAAAALNSADAHSLVVSRALQRIAEYRVGMVDQRHARCGVGVAGIAVGMVLLDQAAIRRPDYGRARVRTDFQEFVKKSIQDTSTCCRVFIMVTALPPFANRFDRFAACSRRERLSARTCPCREQCNPPMPRASGVGPRSLRLVFPGSKGGRSFR